MEDLIPTRVHISWESHQTDIKSKTIQHTVDYYTPRCLQPDVSLIQCSTTMVIAIWSTLKGTMRYSAATACIVPFVTEELEKPHSTLKGTP